MKSNKYVIEVNKDGYSVVDEFGEVVYDMMGEWLLAEVVCDLLNQGEGPEWGKMKEHVNAEVQRRRFKETA